MNENDKHKIIERYNKRLQKFGSTIDALASGVEERRQLRFSVLTGIGIGQGDRVLDLGCGFGDFYTYLEKTLGNDSFDYLGVDINKSLVEVARKNIPKASFVAQDIINDPLEEKFDYVVSTSSFNLKLESEDNYEFIKALLESCYKLATKGVAIDFLTSYVDFQGSTEAFYYEPEKIFSIAKSITKRVTLRHDYPLFDFCIYMYPDFNSWTTKS